VLVEHVGASDPETLSRLSLIDAGTNVTWYQSDDRTATGTRHPRSAGNGANRACWHSRRFIFTAGWCCYALCLAGCCSDWSRARIRWGGSLDEGAIRTGVLTNGGEVIPAVSFGETPSAQAFAQPSTVEPAIRNF